MRIVFVAPPFAGHLYALVPLARAARDAGYSVEFITGERKWTVLERQGFRVVRLPSLLGARLEAIANSPERVGSNPVLMLRQLRENLDLLPAIRHELVNAWKAAPPDLVVADFIAPIAGIVCEELGLPWITTIGTPFAIENHRGVPAYLGGWRSGDAWWHKSRDAAGRGITRAFKQAVFRWRRDEFRRLGFKRLYREDGSEAIYSPRAVLGFGIPELEFERDWPKSFRMIGPVVESPETCPPLDLTGTGKRVLATLGTHLLWAKKDIVARTIALSSALPGVQFVVSLGSPEEAGGMPEKPAPRVTVHPFVPYHRDLGCFDAVVHHGGAGITYAAILAGVPSLVVPHDYDQFDYAARIVHHGLGMRSKSLADPRAPESILRLLDRAKWPAVVRFQDFAARLRPVETFLAIVKEMVG